ncbi:MAG: OmpA family protein [Candidatus Omnitrophota bacterium]
MKNFKFAQIVLVCFSAILFAGCSVGFYAGRPSDKALIAQNQHKIREHKAQIVKLETELASLKQAKTLMESKLKQEITDNQIDVDLQDRGLVITFLTEILFDSGKSTVKVDGQKMLDKIASVVLSEDMSNDIGIEGHTDNVPIQFSGFKSNWELSTARATSVLHYMLDSCGLDPENLSATGYGEYQPVASNDTAEGRQQNRRVEIIIKPEELSQAEKKPFDIVSQ